MHLHFRDLCSHDCCCPRDAKPRPGDCVSVPVRTPYTTLYEQTSVEHSSFSVAPMPGHGSTSAANEPPSKMKEWNQKNDMFKEGWLRSQRASGSTGEDHVAAGEHPIG